MQTQEELIIEEARKAYGKVAKEAMESKSLKLGSDSRLMKVIKESSRDFVHDTGQIRMEDIDNVGSARAKKLAEIGIFSPDDLYDEFKRKHYEELLALQKIDGGLNAELLAKIISASQKMPEEIFGTGYVDLTLGKFPVSKIFDIFKKQISGESITRAENRVLNSLGDIEYNLKEQFKRTNSVESSQSILSNFQDRMSDEPEPFLVKDKQGYGGRRVDEIRKFFSKMSFIGDDVITLQEPGAYLTQSVKERICQIQDNPVACESEAVTIGLKEIYPEGRKIALRKNILKLSKRDLTRSAKNSSEKILGRGSTFKKLNATKDEIAELMNEMIEEGILSGSPDLNVYPSNEELLKDVVRPKLVIIGKTSNPRITDHLKFIHMKKEEDFELYMDRLMQQTGKAVLEHKSIMPDRFTLKIPVTSDNYEKDMSKAIEILGINIKTGFAPLGYDYKTEGSTKQFNTFNVMIRPAFSIVNRVHNPIRVENKEDSFTFYFEQVEDKSLIPNIGLTNILNQNKTKYLTSLCPITSGVKTSREFALAKSLISSADIIKEQIPVVKNNRITRPSMGAITGMYFLAKTIKPDLIQVTEEEIRDKPVWTFNSMTSDIKKVLNDKEVNDMVPIVREKMAKKANNEKVRFTQQENKLASLLSLSDRFVPLLKKSQESKSNAFELINDQKTKNIGKYNRQRRIGCTLVPQEVIEEELVFEIPKSSQAGKDISNFLSTTCPELNEKCITENLSFHQNVTDNVGKDQYKDNLFSSTVRRINKQKVTRRDLDKSLKMLYNKVFGSGETFTGGKKEIDRVFGTLLKQERTLDLGKWKFLDDPSLNQFS